MQTVSSLKKGLLSIAETADGIARQAMRKNISVAKDLVAGQLAQGIESNGELTSFSYAPITIARKRGKSGIAGITNRLTNYDTGESYDKLYMIIPTTGDVIKLGTKSSEIKEAAISERMDNKAFGLSPDSRDIWVKQYVRPEFISRLIEKLKSK